MFAWEKEGKERKRGRKILIVKKKREMEKRQ